MSMLNFIRGPFPDNHDSFDYSPKSFSDVQHEVENAVKVSNDHKRQNQLMSLFTSIFK